MIKHIQPLIACSGAPMLRPVPPPPIGGWGGTEGVAVTGRQRAVTALAQCGNLGAPQEEEAHANHS